MEYMWIWIKENTGILTLVLITISILLNIFLQKWSHKQNREQFEALQHQNREQFEASQKLTGYIAKKTIVKKAPPEWEDKPYRKRKERTRKTPEEAEIDRLIGVKRPPT